MDVQLRYWSAEAPEHARECTLREFPAVVGRDAASDLQLDHPRVSRRHVSIEVTEEGADWVDLGSSNGFRWKGERRRHLPVRVGQRIEVGGFIIEVLAAPERTPVILPGPGAPPDAKPRVAAEEPGERVLDGTRRRRWINLVVPVLLTVSIVGFVAYRIAIDDSAKETVDSGADSKTLELRSELDALERELERTDRVDLDLWRRVQELGVALRAEPGGPDAELARLEFEVDRRRRTEFQSHYEAVRAELVDAIDADRCGAAVKRFAEATAALPELLSHEEAAWEGLGRWVNETLVERHRRFEHDYEFLVAFGSADELREFFAKSRREFEHSALEPFIAEKIGLVDVAARETEHVVASSSTGTPPVRMRDPNDGFAIDDDESEARPSGNTPVAELAAPRVDERAFREALIALLRSAPDPEAAAGGWASLNDDELLAACIEHLEHEALLEASEIAFRWSRRTPAEALLDRYLRANPKVRRAPVEAMLARLEGLDEVPAGGYVYSKEHGWESAIARHSREVLAEFEESVVAIDATRSLRTFERELERALAWIADESISIEVRTTLRHRLIDALLAARAEFASELEGALSRGFEQLRAAKVELNERRKKAYAVIMDPAIYLPENHPDWTKGDVVNGQREVDRVVGLVRELWEDPRYGFSVPARAKSRLALFVRLEQEVFPELRATLPDLGSAVARELRLNPFVVQTLQTYALDETEAKVRDFNRKVREYNAAFRHEDLPELDRQHVIFMSDHREMMGVRRCFIDIRLCRATFGHSKVCNAAGRIWHNGPNGTPQSRAQAEGFEAGVGENVALGYGNPRDIWTSGWYRASDHHRNAISPNWNCMGYGYFGQVGTQNFASITAPF